MSAIEINHINIRASADLITVLRDFYCDALQLQVGKRPPFTSQGYWLYAGDRALIHLSICRKDEQRQPHVVNTLDHIAFTCTDQTAMRARLTELDIKFTHDSVPGASIQQLFFYDPAGNGVELSFIDDA